MLLAGCWCVWGEKWREGRKGRKGRKSGGKGEREVELRKVNGGDSGVGSVVGSLSEGGMVKEVEDVWVGEWEGESPVDGKEGKGRGKGSWWGR